MERSRLTEAIFDAVLSSGHDPDFPFKRPEGEIFHEARVTVGGAVLWEELRLLRELFTRFRQSGIDAFPCWYFSDDDFVPLNPTNETYLSRLFGSPPSELSVTPAEFMNRWTSIDRTRKKQSSGFRRSSDSFGPGSALIESAAAKFSQLFSRSLTTAASVTGSTHFQVFNVSSGYRIHWTHQYWMSPVVFGAPSSPVSGTLPYGLYRFGGDTNGPLVWDPGIHSVSSTQLRADLTAF